MTTRGVQSSAELVAVLKAELARQQEVIPGLRARLAKKLSVSRIWGVPDIMALFDAAVQEITEEAP